MGSFIKNMLQTPWLYGLVPIIFILIAAGLWVLVLPLIGIIVAIVRHVTIKLKVCDYEM
jgi:hypothetical protein